jgi:hypothetical protein
MDRGYPPALTKKSPTTSHFFFSSFQVGSHKPLVAALVLARTMQRSAANSADLDLLVHAIELENRALAAIKLHLPMLPAKKPRQLRLPGL